jgi:hypothetical protein
MRRGNCGAKSGDARRPTLRIVAAGRLGDPLKEGVDAIPIGSGTQSNAEGDDAMRQAIAIVTVACVLTMVTAAAGPTTGSRTPHVRSDNPRIQEVIGFAVARSESFQDLMATLDQSDRIVYLEERGCPVREQVSCLYLVPNTRNLVIHVNPRQPIRTAAANLAHELYHAAEISRAPDVVDISTLQALYERIGEQSCGTQWRHGCWETRAAQAFETLVMRQMAGGPLHNVSRTPKAR